MSFVAISKLRSLRLSNNNKDFTIMNKWACNSLWNRLLGWVDWFSGLVNQVLSGFNRRSSGRFGLNRANNGQFDRFSGSGFHRGSESRVDTFGLNRANDGQFGRFSGSGFNRGSGCEFDRFRSSSGFNRTSGGQFDRFIRGLDIRSGHNRVSVGKCKRFCRVLDHNLGHGSRGRNRASGVYNRRSGGCNVCLELFTVAVTASTAAESTASNDN